MKTKILLALMSFVFFVIVTGCAVVASK